MKILTFDIEEWFHILENDSTETEKTWGQYESRIHANVDRILELLERKKCKATFFCLGWIGKKYPEVVKKISGLGYEVGSHSFAHQLAHGFGREEFEKDLRDSIAILEDITGKKVVSYRAPGFSFTPNNKWVFDVLIKNGIERDCSIFPGKRAHGGFESLGINEPYIIELNGGRIKEFPINFYRLGPVRIFFSGGGYFRLLPYPILQYLTGNTDYMMTYFHPRDFDPGQPMISELPICRKIKSYCGLRDSLKKLENLIDKFAFTDLITADSTINWQKRNAVNLNTPTPPA